MSALVNKHNTMIMGVDMHMVTPPMSAPVLMPHPFVGYVFDPNDYVPSNCSIFVNGVPIARHYYGRSSEHRSSHSNGWTICQSCHDRP